MVDSMALALEHKINNPDDSYKKVADLYGVSKSSLYDRHTGAHASIDMPEDGDTLQGISSEKNFELV